MFLRAVQYHPEFDLREVANLLMRNGEVAIEGSFFEDEASRDDHVGDLSSRAANTDDLPLASMLGIDNDTPERAVRTTATVNWIRGERLAGPAGLGTIKPDMYLACANGVLIVAK